MTYKQHILKSIITVRSLEPVVRNLVENSVISLLCEKLRPIFKLDVFNFVTV